MLPRRPERTFADMLGSKVIPVLIMLLVGSLVFFLLNILYAGPYVARLRWTMFWFVLAMVLVARISVEEGYAKAGLYGVALAWATAMWIFRFVDFVFGVLLFLAFIWWCAYKLVWDCASFDEDEDTSGEGLMDVAGFALPGEVDAKIQRTLMPWWKRLFKNESERADAPHAPGLWIVYFSTFALPCFGLGYAIVPEAQRAAAFRYLWVFVVCAMGLLLLSSFLSLRRYLRQRYLPMPFVMTRKWLQWGIGLMLLVMVGAMILPRPDATYNVSGLVGAITSPEQTADRKAFTSNGGVKGEGDERTASEQERKTTVSKGTIATAGRGGARKQPASTQTQQQRAPLSLATTFSSLLRPLLGLILLILVLLGIILYWRVILDFLRSTWSDFKASLPASSPSVVKKTIRHRPFSSYQNPFSGGAAGLPWPELVTQTFEALQAWAREHGTPRKTPQTPLEFSMGLAERFPEMGAALISAGEMYSHVAYGTDTHAGDASALQQLWNEMRSNQPLRQ